MMSDIETAIPSVAAFEAQLRMRLNEMIHFLSMAPHASAAFGAVEGPEEEAAKLIAKLGLTDRATLPPKYKDKPVFLRVVSDQTKEGHPKAITHSFITTDGKYNWAKINFFDSIGLGHADDDWRVMHPDDSRLKLIEEHKQMFVLAVRGWLMLLDAAKLNETPPKAGAGEGVASDPHAPYYPPAHFKNMYGIPGDRLRKARQRGALPVDKVRGRWHYSEPGARKLWPSEVTDGRAQP